MEDGSGSFETPSASSVTSVRKGRGKHRTKVVEVITTGSLPSSYEMGRGFLFLLRILIVSWQQACFLRKASVASYSAKRRPVQWRTEERLAEERRLCHFTVPQLTPASTNRQLCSVACRHAAFLPVPA